MKKAIKVIAIIFVVVLIVGFIGIMISGDDKEGTQTASENAGDSDRSWWDWDWDEDDSEDDSESEWSSDEWSDDDYDDDDTDDNNGGNNGAAVASNDKPSNDNSSTDNTSNTGNSGNSENSGNYSDAQSVLMMVYMIGSNLESDYGLGSSDLEEMYGADLSSGNLTIVIETGGSTSWSMEGISPDKLGRYVMDKNGFTQVDSLKNACMTDPNTLLDFINWAKSSYPADRYIIDFWDHGGGTLYGYGSDDNYASNGSMSLLGISSVLASTGIHFDIVGFDACLMATIENAYMLSSYADYLLASEETEPGNGWYYTNFVSKLAANPGISSVELGKLIIDDYADSLYVYDGYAEDGFTLSLMDLSKVSAIYENMSDFFSAAKNSIKSDNKNYSKISKARSSAREYGENSYDQVDLIDVISKTDFLNKDELLAAAKEAVLYSKTNLSGSNGIAVYFPDTANTNYSAMNKMLKKLDYTAPLDFYDYFLSVKGKSTSRSGSRSFVAPSEEVAEDVTEEDWYVADEVEDFEYLDSAAANTLAEDGSTIDLPLTETDNGFELVLTDEQADTALDFYINVLQAFEDGYVYLGYDDAFDLTDDDNIVVEYDYNWLCLNDQPVAYYAEPVYDDEENSQLFYSGIVPALLNDDKLIDIKVVWDPIKYDGSDTDTEAGTAKTHIVGYRTQTDDVNGTAEKGWHEFKKGDRITALFSFFDEDGNYIEEVEMGEEIVVTSMEDLVLDYCELEAGDVIVWGTLVDIYGNEADTEAIAQ